MFFQKTCQRAPTENTLRGKRNTLYCIPFVATLDLLLIQLTDGKSGQGMAIVILPSIHLELERKASITKTRLEEVIVTITLGSMMVYLGGSLSRLKGQLKETVAWYA